VAYIRALQLSRMAEVTDLDPAVREALEHEGEYDPHATAHEGDDHGSAH
jgi:hypothetical protein